jgi:GH25 family lysozyme M1 (1,4-beta-N-acetylmuramidase)
MPIVPVVADMNHANSVNFTEVATWCWGVIHKARQGVGFGDPAYKQRKVLAKSLGLLWKPYDFATGDDVATNVADFIAYSGANATDGGCLDFEDNTQSEMTGDEALEFLDRFNQKIGVACWIYGGNRIREQIDHQSSKWIDMAKITPLWECRYIGGQPVDDADEWKKVPPIPPWTTTTLIQYTGDGIGPRPHTMPGVENGADLNVFDGSRNQLAAVWPGAAIGTTA